jgi:hypothetical protein
VESDIQAAAIKALRDRDCECHKLGQNGDPDWIVVYAPRCCFYLEFKQPGGGLTAAQKVRFKELINRGHAIVMAEDSLTPVLALEQARLERHRSR